MENYKIYAKTVEEEALKQIKEMSKSDIGENAHIRIMPDCHSGKSCVIGTTMKVIDKVCPNVVGVDIGCGVTLMKVDIDFSKDFNKLDEVIRKNIPNGMNVHEEIKPYDFSKMICWDKLAERTKDKSQHSFGTLGGGNHFIEVYEDGFVAVHTGSRNIGLEVAKYYQSLAESNFKKKPLTKEFIENIVPSERENFIKEYKKENAEIKDFPYLSGKQMRDYLHDINILQRFASENRIEIINNIVKEFKQTANVEYMVNSIHNYIDVENMILRKGAISAQKGEMLVIPLNMRDGLLVCEGKGNEDWNYSAPHGAGRLYSRTKAKQEIKLEDFEKSMQGIYTTCVNESTLDESPFAYKDYEEIMECIEPTVDIIERLIPIYNFKAN